MANNRDNNIYVDGTPLPVPPKDGVSMSREPIWSSNAGRTADCTFVGDIRAWKWNISISWGKLSLDDVAAIRGAFSTLNKPYFNITFTDDTGTRRTIRCYSTSPKSTVQVYEDDDGSVSGASVDIVEV